MVAMPKLVAAGDWIGPDPIARQPKTQLDPTASAGIIEADISSVAGDRVIFDLGRFGQTTTLDTGIKADVITGYDEIKVDEAAKKHGSPAPRSMTVDDATFAQLQALTPGQALDAISKVLGGPGGCEDYLTKSPLVNDPGSPGWAGFCDELFSMILSPTIHKHLEVQGPDGERGLCIGDCWISRADLTNLMGALLGRTMTSDKNIAFLSIGEDNGATDQLKGIMKWTGPEGAGCVCSVWYDLAHGGEHEIWNQTFIRSDTTPRQEIVGPAADALLAKAGNPPGAKVIQIDQIGYYAVEAGNDNEANESVESERNWTYYAVVKPAPDLGPNKVELVKAFMADSKDVADLDVPTKASEEKVAYFWKPSLNELKDLINNATDWNVDRSAAGQQLRFFIACLDRGVPGQVRDNFEAAWKGLQLQPGESASLAQAQDLLAQFPGIAVAYAPKTWAANFPGLDYASFFKPPANA
jgi:hypothetical protein